MRRLCVGIVWLCWLWSGVGMAHLGLHKELDRLSARLRKTPNDVVLLLRRSDLYRRHGDIGLAEIDLRRVSLLQPKHPQLSLAWGRLWYTAGRWGAAEAVLEKARGEKAVSWEVYALLAEIWKRKQRWDEALRAYRESVRRRPQPHLYLAAGRMMEDKGRVEEAIRWYRAGVVVLKGAVVLRLALLRLLRKHGRFEEAVRVVDAAMVGLPVRADWWTRRAELYERMGKTQAAKADRLRALEEVRGQLHRRSSPLNRAREVRVLWALGRYEEARRCVGLWLRVYPKDGIALRWERRLKAERR